MRRPAAQHCRDAPVLQTKRDREEALAADDKFAREDLRLRRRNGRCENGPSEQTRRGEGFQRTLLSQLGTVEQYTCRLGPGERRTKVVDSITASLRESESWAFPFLWRSWRRPASVSRTRITPTRRTSIAD